MLVRFSLYLLALLGCWMFVTPLMRKTDMYKPYRAFPRAVKKRSKGNLERHLEMLLSVTVNRKSSYALHTFLIVSGSLAFITAFFSSKTGQSWTTTLFVSVVFGLMPYMVLRLRLYNIRIKSSYEGVQLVTELIGQYKMNYFNMIEAIDRTIPHLKNEPYTRRALFRMALELKQYRSLEELDEIVKAFVFSINTEWAQLLGNSIYLAIGYKDNVQTALEDILDDLKDLKNITEIDKRENTESFLMIRFLGPGLYLLGVWACFQVFGFTLQKFIEYQFHYGFNYFILTILLNFANFVLYYFIRRPKNDF